MTLWTSSELGVSSSPEVPAAAWVSKEVEIGLLYSAVMDAVGGVCVGLATRVEEERLVRATGSFLAILNEPWPWSEV
jgi:hypothetical protein